MYIYQWVELLSVKLTSECVIIYNKLGRIILFYGIYGQKSKI